jgi:hypothetical protein
MNSAQNLFVFQVLFGDVEDGFNFPKEMNEEKDETDGQSFCEEINEFKEKQEKGWDETDHWIGITSKKIIVPNKTRENKYIYKVSREGARPNVYLITSRDWEREYCPPSLFEYLVLAVFICSGRSLIDDLLKHAGTGIPPDPHNSISMTGCICDNNTPQDEWRIRISNPSLCYPCRARLTRIEEKIPGIHLVEQIDNILSRKWMGSPDSRDTPLYNLRKNYGHKCRS